MTRPKNSLTDQLARLPAARASTGFTERVLARLDEPLVAERELYRPFLWSAAAAAVLVLVALALRPSSAPTKEGLSAEVTEIRRQHLLLTEELERLRTRTRNAAPVVYLGGSEQVDYVLDLSPLLPGEPLKAVPASRRSEPGTF